MLRTIDLPVPPMTDPDQPPVPTGVAVTLFNLSGGKFEGHLESYDHDTGKIQVSDIVGADTMTFDCNELKAMQLLDPIQWTPDKLLLKQERTRGLMIPPETQQFIIVFKDKSILQGECYGTRTDKFGLHIFKTHAGNQYIKEYIHVFIPDAAIEKRIIGEQLGEILVQDQHLPRHEIDLALTEQEQGRQRPLGEYLIKHKVVNTQQLHQALEQQKSGGTLKLGEILVSERLVTERQLAAALREQKRDRKTPLGELLIRKGLVTRDQIQQALAKKMGVPFVNLHEFKIDAATLRALPVALVLQHNVVPLYRYENKLAVAIVNPLNFETLDAIAFHSGKSIEPVMATDEDIDWALKFFYGADSDLLETLDDYDTAYEPENKFEELQTLEEADVADNIVVKLINKIVMDAYKQGASDIHIEPFPGGKRTVIRFRKDGTLVNYHEFPPQYRNALVSRIKVMAKLDISERRKPQDGKITFRHFGPADIELRVATIPTTGDVEDVVMRLLVNSRALPIDQLGLTQDNEVRLIEAITKSYGLLLVCGPTGSGKTTTLHAVLKLLDDSERKIWTAEDPVEITQPGLRQVQINPKIGLTFASAMRSFLRADPDIIMVGEMRDRETATTGIEASLTGHLVLSTLHTNSAAESVNRLLEMGMEPYNFADALIAILAQRLAKTLCPMCKERYTPDERELRFLACEYLESGCQEKSSKKKDTALDQQIQSWHDRYAEDGKLQLYQGKGCDYCDNSGYRGRIAIHELLVATPTIRQLILSHATVTEIQAEALKSGTHTLKQDGIEKVIQGHTTYAKVMATGVK